MRTNFRGALAGLVRGVPATLSLMLANAAVFAAMSAIDNRAGDSLGQAAYLTQWGANVGALSFTGEPWRLLSNVFMHAGWLHLLFNSLALLEIGGIVERRLGSWRMLAIYLLSGLGGAYASARWQGLTVSVGASGAIFGLLGALIVFGLLARRRLRGPYGEPVSPWRALLFGGLTLALGPFFQLDNAAHIGGWLTGTALALPALLAEQARRPKTAALLFALAVAAGAAALAGLTAHAFDPGLAARVRFAQLTAALRAADAGANGILRRCALETADERNGTPAEAFKACLALSMRDGGAAPPGDIAGRYGALIDHNRHEAWPLCHRRAERLLGLDLPPTRRTLVDRIGRYCAARAQIEASLSPGSPLDPTGATALRADLLGYELLDALADPNYAPPPAVAAPPGRTALQREADALGEWRASITPDDEEIAALTDCPQVSCRRAWAR